MPASMEQVVSGNTKLDDLPDELKLMVFNQAYLCTSGKEFINILLVCKEWSKLGTSLLRSHIVINNNNLISWIKFARTAPQFAGNQVKSLSMDIHLPIEGRSFKDIDLKGKFMGVATTELLYRGRYRIACGRLPTYFEEARKNGGPWKFVIQEEYERGDLAQMEWYLVRLALDEICALVERTLRALTTFLFRVHSHNGADTPRTRLLPSTPNLMLDDYLLGNLLRALPESCVTIEVDDLGLTPNDESHALRGIIRSMLPRLHHLSLRTSSICPFIIDDDMVATMMLQNRTFRKMKTLDLAVHPCSELANTYDWPCPCGSSVMTWFAPGSPHIKQCEANIRSIGDAIRAQRRKAVVAGLFPKL